MNLTRIQIILVVLGFIFILQGLLDVRIIPYEWVLVYWGVDPETPYLLFVFPFFDLFIKFSKIFVKIFGFKANKKISCERNYIDSMLQEHQAYEDLMQVRGAFEEWGVFFVKYITIFALAFTIILFTSPFTGNLIEGDGGWRALINNYIGLAVIWTALKPEKYLKEKSI